MTEHKLPVQFKTRVRVVADVVDAEGLVVFSNLDEDAARRIVEILNERDRGDDSSSQ